MYLWPFTVCMHVFFLYVYGFLTVKGKSDSDCDRGLIHAYSFLSQRSRVKAQEFRKSTNGGGAKRMAGGQVLQDKQAVICSSSHYRNGIW